LLVFLFKLTVKHCHAFFGDMPIANLC